MKIEIELKDPVASALAQVAEQEMRTMEAQVVYILSKAVTAFAASGAKKKSSEKRILELCAQHGGMTKGVLLSRMRGDSNVEGILAHLVADGRLKVVPAGKHGNTTRFLTTCFEETR